MRLSTVPNWSFGRDKALLSKFHDILSRDFVTLHYCESDVDHNRTVTGFTADEEVLPDLILRLAMASFDSIDLNKHVGVHPRIGALDVCPFVLPPDSEGLSDELRLMKAQAVVERCAGVLSGTFDLPIFLYEKSERGRHESDLPSLRKGGFGSLLDKELRPDFGPAKAHPRLGVTVMGVRDFLVALNVNLETEDLTIAKDIARQIRENRSIGDARFLGVRALGLPLASRGQTQVSMNLTLPDLTPIDPILEWIAVRATKAKVKVAENELIGVIRRRDLEHATRLPYRPEQIVD